MCACRAAAAGATDAVVCWHHARGGEGALDLGNAVIKACQQPTNFKFLYPLEASIKVRAPPLAWSMPSAERHPETHQALLDSLGSPMMPFLGGMRDLRVAQPTNACTLVIEWCVNVVYVAQKTCHLWLGFGGE